MGAMKIMLMATGILVAAGAVQLPAAENPFLGIVVRNVFGLKDPPPPPRPEDNRPPPPKILLNGFATALGKAQVLFEVETPPKPPQPGGKTYFMLGVGEIQDEIEVIEISEEERKATFRNHGIVEIKTVEKDSARPVAGALPVPGMPPGGGIIPRPSVPSLTPGLQSIPVRINKSIPSAVDAAITPPSLPQ
jgi:hypothetical protein